MKEAVTQFWIGRDQFKKGFLGKLGKSNVGHSLHAGRTWLPRHKGHLAKIVPRPLGIDRILDPLVVDERHGDRPAENKEQGVSRIAPENDRLVGGKDLFGQAGDDRGKIFLKEILENMDILQVSYDKFL